MVDILYSAVSGASSCFPFSKGTQPPRPSTVLQTKISKYTRLSTYTKNCAFCTSCRSKATAKEDQITIFTHHPLIKAFAHKKLPFGQNIKLNVYRNYYIFIQRNQVFSTSKESTSHLNCNEFRLFLFDEIKLSAKGNRIYHSYFPCASNLLLSEPPSFFSYSHFQKLSTFCLSLHPLRYDPALFCNPCLLRPSPLTSSPSLFPPFQRRLQINCKPCLMKSFSTLTQMTRFRFQKPPLADVQHKRPSPYCTSQGLMRNGCKANQIVETVRKHRQVYPRQKCEQCETRFALITYEVAFFSAVDTLSSKQCDERFSTLYAFTTRSLLSATSWIELHLTLYHSPAHF